MVPKATDLALQCLNCLSQRDSAEQFALDPITVLFYFKPLRLSQCRPSSGPVRSIRQRSKYWTSALKTSSFRWLILQTTHVFRSPRWNTHPEVRTVVLDTIKRIVAAGVPAGLLSADRSYTDEGIEAGAVFVAPDIDMVALKRGIRLNQ